EHLVQQRIDQPERVVGDLGGQGHDAGEFRGGLAGTADQVEPRRDAGRAQVDENGAVTGRAHRDVGNAAVRAGYRLNAVLVGRAGEDDRLAAAGGERVRARAPGEGLLQRLVEGVVPHVVRGRA